MKLTNKKTLRVVALFLVLCSLTALFALPMSAETSTETETEYIIEAGTYKFVDDPDLSAFFRRGRLYISLSFIRLILSL